VLLATIEITTHLAFLCVMPSRVIAIGDVHGCATALRALTEIFDPKPADTVVMLGDCVDRGPESRQVIEQLFRLRDSCRLIPLLGNHEEMMLNYVDGKPQPDDWLDVGGLATMRSYGPSLNPQEIPPSHIDYIRTWGDYVETASHFFAHGSYDPDRALDQQHWQTMRWQSLKFGVPGPHLSGKTAIVGHSSQKSGEVLNLGHLICIDTFCWGGGWLTALETTTGQLWQVDRDGRPRTQMSAAQSEKPA
jgi:serine/threonine protein phosphatase 1